MKQKRTSWDAAFDHPYAGALKSNGTGIYCRPCQRWIVTYEQPCRTLSPGVTKVPEPQPRRHSHQSSCLIQGTTRKCSAPMLSEYIRSLHPVGPFRGQQASLHKPAKSDFATQCSNSMQKLVSSAVRCILRNESCAEADRGYGKPIGKASSRLDLALPCLSYSLAGFRGHVVGKVGKTIGTPKAHKHISTSIL